MSVSMMFVYMGWCDNSGGVSVDDCRCIWDGVVVVVSMTVRVKAIWGRWRVIRWFVCQTYIDSFGLFHCVDCAILLCFVYVRMCMYSMYGGSFLMFCGMYLAVGMDFVPCFCFETAYTSHLYCIVAVIDWFISLSNISMQSVYLLSSRTVATCHTNPIRLECGHETHS